MPFSPEPIVPVYNSKAFDQADSASISIAPPRPCAISSACCSIIGKEIGFENIGVDANIDTSTHGNEASFEFIVDKNPDYIFAMDRDAAIGTDGAQMAQEILENELVKSTDAYKNGHVVYLAHPNVWYTAEGGIQALSEMLSDLENALL